MTAADLIQRAGLAYVCPITIERDLRSLPVEYLPQNLYENHSHVPLNRHGKGPFCRLEIPKLTEGPGVYAITVDDSVVYIGECQNFRERYGPRGYGVFHPRNCFVGGQPTNCKVNARILEATLKNSIPDLRFVPEAASSRKLIEEDLVLKFQPRWNGRG